MNYSEYRDLTPIDNIENGDEYINALSWAFNNKSIKNIALAGPYGSGKSSIIKSYLAKGDNKKCSKIFHVQNPVKKNSLVISMATFLTENSEKSTNTDIKIRIDAEEIEKGILKQLFYKVKPERIPQSRYRKLHKINFFAVFIRILIFLTLIEFLTLFFSPNSFNQFEKLMVGSLSLLHFSSNFTLLFNIILLLLFSILGTYIYLNIISQFKIKEIKLPKDTTVQRGTDESESVFNKNLDEIVYFFEATGYRTVFFEDLDRLDDPKIFIHLRELNNILNNDDAIKKKPIVFVYAVRDDIFSKEDRTKFFDFIIPVIPIINSTNSEDILMQKFQEANNNGIQHKISSSFIIDVAPYISDMRILQNTYNEFIMYKKTLKTMQELTLSDEQMFAMIIFKNLFPRDFADIQNEKGILKKALNDKKDFIKNEKLKIQKEIDEYSTTLENIKKEVLISIRELKYAMFGTLIGEIGEFSGFCTRSGLSPSIKASTIMDDTYDMTQLLQAKYESVCYYRRPTNSLKYKDFNEDTINHFIKRWELLKKGESDNLQKMQERLQYLKDLQHSLTGMSLIQLLNKYSTSEVFSTEVQDNKILVFLLRRGYIDEKYANYINYFKGTSITKDDMNFILSIKNETPLAFDYPLSKTKMVIQKLQEYEYENKAVYNFDLLEQLLSDNQKSNKLNTFMYQLSDETITSWNFIDEFIDRTKYTCEFIQMLTRIWSGIWTYIYANNTMSYERKIHYLVLIIDNTDDDVIISLNNSNCLKNFIEEHPNVLRDLSVCQNINRIIATIDCLELCFARLSIEGVNETVLEYIFSNKHFILNEEMIHNAIAFISPECLDVFQKQPYSAISMLDYKPVTDFISENIQDYTENIILNHEIIADNFNDIDSLIILLKDDINLCTRLIIKEQFHVNDITKFLSELLLNEKEIVLPLWNTLLSQNKVDATWENVVKYWNEFEITEALCTFIATNIEQLIDNDCSVVNDSLIEQIINADIEQEVLKKLLPVLRLHEFNLDIRELPESTVKIMVDCSYFDFTVDRFNILCALYPPIANIYILKNQEAFTNSLDEVMMSNALFETILTSTQFSISLKQATFDKYASKCMTSLIAMKMNDLSVSITAEAFDAAWKCIEIGNKEMLMYKNLNILCADDFEHCFSDLGGEYALFLDRNSSHDVTLSGSPKHKQLVERLKEVNYITSFHLVEKSDYDTVLETENHNLIKCRIKRIK